MRIAVFHNQPSGGARRAMHGFATELGRSHTIDVYTLTSADNSFLRDQAVANRVVREQYAPRRPVRFGLYLNDIRRARDLRDLVTLNARIAARIDAAGYDVALVDVCRYTLVPPILSALQTPAVYYAHDPPARAEREQWQPTRTRWARMRDGWHKPFEDRHAQHLEALQRRSVKAAAAVAANSRHTAAGFQDAFDVEAVVCPPGVTLPADAAAMVRGVGVLSVGEVEPHKGYPFLVDALARLDPNARPTLRIVANRANPVERARLEQRAARAGVTLEIEIGVPEDRLRSAYTEAAVFVFAAHDEPLGLAPLEAMARATPVVAVGEGGVHETVVDGVTGYLTRRDADSFAARLGPLLRDEDELRRLGTNAREHVARHWSWSARAAALEEVLVDVADRAPARMS
jgi:glycosyltransferase involved in cell wall biosynthesis